LQNGRKQGPEEFEKSNAETRRKITLAVTPIRSVESNEVEVLGPTDRKYVAIWRRQGYLCFWKYYTHGFP